MLNFKEFAVGQEHRVCEHICEQCGHKSTIILGSGYENDRSFRVGWLKYQCDCNHHWVRYICPNCNAKLVAQSNRRAIPGDKSANSKWEYRKITGEDLKKYLADFGKEETITDDQNDWVCEWLQP